VHNRFDQLVKQLARGGFSAGGHVETDAEASPDAQRIDLWFMPDSARAPRALAPLGLLGRMGRTACTLEAFHRTPVGDLVADCIARHRFFCRELHRRKPRPPMPTQWILCAGRPSTALTGLDLHRAPRSRGIYDAARLWRTRLVVVCELPRTRDTLLVRLMGAGKTLAQAIADLRALPPEAPEYRLALPILIRLRIEIPADPAKQTKSDREFLMTTQEVDKYLADIEERARTEGQKKGLAEGQKKGLAEGQKVGREEGERIGVARVLLDQLAAKLGPVPAKVRTRVGDASLAELTGWTRRVLTAASFDDVFGPAGRPRRSRRLPAAKTLRPAR